MSEKIIREFCQLLEEHGVPVSATDIVADDEKHRIKCTLDNKNDKTVRYQLKVDGDVGIGWFHSFKHGMNAGNTIKFISKAPRKLTPEEKLAWAIKIADSKKLAAIKATALDAKQARMANRLKKCFFRMRMATDHPYLTKKQIKYLLIKSALRKA